MAQTGLKKSVSPIILRPKKSPTVLQLLGFTVLLGLALWIAIRMTWTGYLCVLICVAGIGATVFRLFSRGNYLLIDNDGFTVCNFFRRTTVRWNVVDKFFVVVVKRRGLRPRRIVGFNYVPTYDRSGLKRGILRAITQCEGALSDTYENKSPRELADLLNAHLQRARKSRGPQGISLAQQAAWLREEFGFNQ